MIIIGVETTITGINQLMMMIKIKEYLNLILEWDAKKKNQNTNEVIKNLMQD